MRTCGDDMAMRGPYEHDEPHGAPWAGQWIDDEVEKAKGTGEQQDQ